MILYEHEKGMIKKTRNAVAECVSKNWPKMDIKEVIGLLNDVKKWFEFEYMKWEDDGKPKKDYTETELFMSIGHSYTEFTEVKKIFCGECAYHDRPDESWKCSAPENKQPNWLGPKEESKETYKINKHNDCKWFKQKED